MPYLASEWKIDCAIIDIIVLYKWSAIYRKYGFKIWNENLKSWV